MIDFIRKSNSLGNKEGFCPCNFSFFSVQVPRADVLVRRQSQLETHVSPEEQNGHILASEPAQVLLPTQHRGDLPPALSLHSKALSNQWSTECVILKAAPDGVTAHISVFLPLQTLLCLFLFFSLSCLKSCHIFHIHWSTSPLWHKQLIITFCCQVSRVGERADILSFRGRISLHAHQCSAGRPGYEDDPRDANLRSCPMLHRSVPGCCTRAAVPRAFCCSAQAGAFPRYFVSLSLPQAPLCPPHLSSASLCSACNRLQWQWLQPAGVCKAEDPLNRCKSHASRCAARQYGSLMFLL